MAQLTPIHLTLVPNNFSRTVLIQVVLSTVQIAALDTIPTGCSSHAFFLATALQKSSCHT